MSSIALGAALPLAVYALVPMSAGIPGVAGTSLVFLAALGGAGARVGGAPVTRAAVRVTFWGALAMALTAGNRVGQAESPWITDVGMVV